MIEFRVLGAIQLRNESGRELAAVLAQPKRLAVLIYLAATPGFSRRDKLVGLLWPEFEQSRARQALNKAVHHLRQSLGDAAIVSRGDQELALEPTVVDCDIRRFETALASGDPATAVDLYRGALADGLFVSEADEFERWLSAERERVRTEAANAAGALADTEASVEWARRAVELSPFDEPAVRRLMSLLAGSGEVAGAAVAYDDLVRRLSKELDVAPSAETRALRESIGDLGGQASPGAALPVSAAASSPTVVGPTSSRRRDSRLIAFVGAVACMVLAIGGIAMARRAGATSTNPALDATRLLVSVLENRTGDSTLNPIGVMAADWMIQGLSVSDSIHVVDSRAAMLLARTGGRTTAQLADAARARFVIAGAYYKEGDSLRFMARLSDATADGQEWTFKPVAVPIDRPEAARLSLQDQARTLVAQAAFPQIGDMLRTRATPLRYDAYREYVRGVDYFVRREEGSANEHFLMAARLDTTFAEALLNAVTTLSLRGTPTADSIMQVLARRREQLSPMSRLWFDATEAARRGDPAAMRHYGELAHRYPDSFFAICYGMELMAFRHVGEADSVLRSLDPNRGWLHGWFSYWPTRVMLDDMLDDVGAARADVVAGARAYPHNVGIAVADARYLARAGTLRQLDSLFDEAVALPTVGDWHAGEVLAAAALEAAAHGHGDWVPHIRDRALQWYASLPAAERGAEPNSGFGLSWMLASVRAWPELRSRVVTLLASTSADSARWLRYEALAAAHVGDTATLTRLDRRLRVAIDRASDAALGELLGERARIAALRGSGGEALDLLRQAFSHNKAFDVFVHTDPSFETIWSEPGFAHLLVGRDGGSP